MKQFLPLLLSVVMLVDHVISNRRSPLPKYETDTDQDTAEPKTSSIQFDKVPISVEQWLNKVTRKASKRHPWRRVNSSNLATSNTNRDYEISAVAAHWPPPAGSHASASHEWAHHIPHHIPTFHEQSHSHFHHHPHPHPHHHIQYIPIPIAHHEKKSDHGLSTIWPFLLLGLAALLLPLLFGLLLLPLGLTFLTSLLQLISLFSNGFNNNNQIPIGVVQPGAVAGRKRRHVWGTAGRRLSETTKEPKPWLFDAILDIGQELDKSLTKFASEISHVQ
ncbi:hypothetical protein HDE_00830 [Halotydeus destructor]|nr:hypothetical protein HDE_00830 [Halotydeus destructor]